MSSSTSPDGDRHPPPAFPATDALAAWVEAAAGPLGLADPAAMPASRTEDGIPLFALYPPANGAPVLGPGRPPARIFAPADPADPETARIALEGGADGLIVAAADGWPDLLDAIGPSVPLRLDGDAAGADAPLAALGGTVTRADPGLDPLAPGAGERAAVWRAAGLAAPPLRADGRRHHEAGATPVQELAAAMASGLAGLRAVEAAGGDLDGAVALTLTADTDLFGTITKLRAARRLWAEIEAACGLDPRPVPIHAETAWRALARRDPATNIVRHAVAAAGAILGGADGLHVLPHDLANGPPSQAARRLSRTIPLVLLREAGLGRVADPAAGSGALEALTDALVRDAWALLSAIEGRGGMGACLASGWWSDLLAEARSARADALREGRLAIVGTTRFADPREPPPAPAPASGRPPRDAEPFETEPAP